MYRTCKISKKRLLFRQFPLSFNKFNELYCVKSVQISSYFWSVLSCIQTEYGDLLRIYGEITPHVDTFHAVLVFLITAILPETLLVWSNLPNQCHRKIFWGHIENIFLPLMI